MSLENLHLRKLIKLIYLADNQKIGEVRTDIRLEIARELGDISGGGDFHSPFWSDARDHTLHIQDLNEATRLRIEANPRRQRLYPLLASGFLGWWNKRRRWTNEPFQKIEAPHARYSIPNLGIFKVEGLLALRDASSSDHFVYPYFSEHPTLSSEAGRIMLWCLIQALPHIDDISLVVLDVLRGQTYTIDRSPLQGNEAEILSLSWKNLLYIRDRLKPEYEQ